MTYNPIVSLKLIPGEDCPDDLLNPSAFREWLESFPDDDSIVGEAQDPYNCPIARFLRSKLPSSCVVIVSPHTITVQDRPGAGAAYATPAWATRFMRHVDAERLDTPITKRDALSYIGDTPITKRSALSYIGDTPS